MKHIKQLTLEIETNRQRLQYALDSKNEELIWRINTLLVQLLSNYFDETKGGFEMRREQKFYLVFSEVYQDGLRVNEDGYQNLLKTMTRFDRETHVRVEIPDGCELIADEMIEISNIPKPWKTDKKPA